MKTMSSDEGFFGKLIDSTTGKRYGVVVSIEGGQLGIHVQGYGDKSSTDNTGEPILLDMNNGRLMVYVWGDINNEDATHTIDLEGARVEKRIFDHNEAMKSKDDD